MKNFILMILFAGLIRAQSTTWIQPGFEQTQHMWMDALNQFDGQLQPVVLADLVQVNGPFTDIQNEKLNAEIRGLVGISDTPDLVWSRVPGSTWPFWQAPNFPVRRRGASDIFSAENGKIYISWHWSHNLSEAHLEGGRFVEDVVWGQAGRADGQLGEPVSVAVTTKGDYVILERLNNRISIFNAQHVFQRAIYPTRQFPMQNPVAMTLHDGDAHWTNLRESFLVIIDADGERLVCMSLEGRILSVVKQDFPFKTYKFVNATTDYYGCVYITDTLNDCIHKFDPDLNYLVSLALTPDGELMINPTGITLDNRYGQGWFSDSTGVHYFWVGTDTLNWRTGFSTLKNAVMGAFRLTEPAYVTVSVKNESGQVLAILMEHQKFLFDTIKYKWPIPWGFDGSTVQLEVQLTPTYASRKYFTKTVKQEITIDASSNH